MVMVQINKVVTRRKTPDYKKLFSGYVNRGVLKYTVTTIDRSTDIRYMYKQL